MREQDRDQDLQDPERREWTVGAIKLILYFMKLSLDGETMSNESDTKGQPAATTTISTIAVQAGDSQIIITVFKVPNS